MKREDPTDPRDPRDPLQCTFADAELNHLRDGIRMSVRAKIELFEEMLDLAWRSGAAQRAARLDEPDT